jgi:hypothetical protein
MKTRLPFSFYRREVSRLVEAKTGLSLDDLPDVAIRDWYDDGVSAKSAASRAIRNAKEC